MRFSPDPTSSTLPPYNPCWCHHLPGCKSPKLSPSGCYWRGSTPPSHSDIMAGVSIMLRNFGLGFASPRVGCSLNSLVGLTQTEKRTVVGYRHLGLIVCIASTLASFLFLLFLNLPLSSPHLALYPLDPALRVCQDLRVHHRPVFIPRSHESLAFTSESGNLGGLRELGRFHRLHALGEGDERRTGRRVGDGDVFDGGESGERGGE